MADYNPAKEAHLLQYNNVSNEVLVDVTRYALDGDAEKYIEMGYSTYLNLEPVIRIRDGCGDFGSGGCQALLNKNSDDLSVRNISRTSDISTDVKIYYNWEHTEGLSSSMARTMTAAGRNRENFVKTITVYCDYQTCTFNRYEMENIFCSKPIIEYRLEVMQLRKLKEFYDNLVKCVIVQKSKRGEIRRMAAAAVVGDVDGENFVVVPDENVRESMDVYEIFEQTLNYKCNINSHNVLCIMETYRHRPGYIFHEQYYVSWIKRDINGIIANIIPSVVKTMVLELVRKNDMLIADLKTKFDSFTSQMVRIRKEILTKIPNSIKIAVEESTKERNIIIEDLKVQLYNLNKRIELLDKEEERGESENRRPKFT
ncbi:hypothetical protein FQA39_LY18519 [Lamprigera yunnana]|nr:hypothetical protein FQA39_LY18519 [Lamprigera yunnana]